MKRREILDESIPPDGERLELDRTGEIYAIRVGGVLLMTSATSGSESQMAEIGAEQVGGRSGARVLVGGLGMGYTLRAVLDRFDDTAEVTVAELLPAVVRFNRGPVAHLAGEPLMDRRVQLVEGDVRGAIAAGDWDAILLDVDNGPGALTAATNAGLYDEAGVARLVRALRPGGVVVVWSVAPDDTFLRRLQRAGLIAEARRVYARGNVKRGPRHTLFVATRPGRL